MWRRIFPCAGKQPRGRDSEAAHLERQQELLTGILVEIVCVKGSCVPCHRVLQPVSRSVRMRWILDFGGVLGFFFLVKHHYIFQYWCIMLPYKQLPTAAVLRENYTGKSLWSFLKISCSFIRIIEKSSLSPVKQDRKRNYKWENHTLDKLCMHITTALCYYCSMVWKKNFTKSFKNTHSRLERRLLPQDDRILPFLSLTFMGLPKGKQKQN